MTVETFAAATAEALLHFVWQGTVLAIVGISLMRRLAGRPEGVYAAGVGTLGAMALAPIVTVAWLLTGKADPGGGVATLVGLAGSNASDAMPVAWILGSWAGGSAVFAARLAGGWWLVRRLVSTAMPGGDYLESLVRRLSIRMKVGRPVLVLQSAHVAVPMVVGWLKPVVLMPVSVAMQVDSRHIEALLLHELAHIKRHDYLVNLLQSAVEVVLFYHPAVWLMSRRVRDARELCCDDIAVQTCDRLTYVAALSRVATMTVSNPALAASGGSLRTRVARLLTPSPAPIPALQCVALLPVLLVVVAAMPVSMTQGPSETPQMATPATSPIVVPDVSPQAVKSNAAVTKVDVPQASPAPESIVRAALPVVLDFVVPTINAASLTGAPVTVPRPLEIDVERHNDRVPIVANGLAVEGGDNPASRSGTVEQPKPGDVVTIAVPSAPALAGEWVLQSDGSLRRKDPATQVAASSTVLFVNGEVVSPGQKQWESGMTVSRALSLSGGLTRTGKLGKIRRPVTQPDGKVKYVEIKGAALKMDTLLEPNDELVIVRKWFGGN